MATGYLGSSGNNTYFKNGPVSLNVTMPANTYPNGSLTLDNMGAGQAYWNNGHVDAHAFDMYLCDSAGNNAVYLFTVALGGSQNSSVSSGTTNQSSSSINNLINNIINSGGSSGNVHANMAYIPNSATVSGAQGLAGKALYVKAVGDSMSLNRLYLRNGTNVTIATAALSNSITCQVSGGHGTLSANKTKAAPGETVTLTPNPATGYEVNTITTSPSVTITNNKFTMPSSAITVTATFKKKNYTITKKVSPSGAGTVTAPSTATYGSSVSVSQTPATGYWFKEWQTSPALTISGGSFSMPAQNVTVTAKYLKRSTASLNKTTLTGGGTATLTITSESSSYTHKYKLSFGTNMETSLTNVAAGVTSVNISIPESWSNYIPNAATKTGGTLIVYTYSGSTQIGSYTISGLTYAVPASAVPALGTITTSIARTIGGVTYADVGDYYVQKHCGVRIQGSASSQLSATISSLKAELVGYSGSSYTKTVSAASIDFTTGLLLQAGTTSIKLTATDSRGRTATQTVTITVTAYNAPDGMLSVKRVDLSEQDDDTGIYGKYELSKAYSAIGNNALTVTMTSQGDSEVISTDSGNILPGSRQTFSTQLEYMITVTLEDAFETTTLQVKLRSAKFILYVSADGKKMGLMKAATHSIPAGKNENIEIPDDAAVWIGDDVLDDYIKDIIEGKILNVLNSSSTTDALSAAQGKALNDKWGSLVADGYITSLANLITLINGKDTQSIIVCGVNSTLATALFGKTDSVAAMAFIFKASANNAYYLCVNRNNAVYGNISLSGSTVSIINPLDQYEFDAGSNTLAFGKMCYGHITNSNGSLYLMYPVHVRPGLSVKSISLTQVTVRGVGGYVMNSITSFTGYTISASIEDDMIRVRLDRSTAYGTNNTPVVGQISGTVVLE